MSTLSLLQNRVPGTLPLFFTTLVQAPRRIFWQDQPEEVLCRLVFGIPQSDGTLCPIFISKPQRSNLWELDAMPLEAETLYGWRIEALESVSKGETLCEGRFSLLSTSNRNALPELLEAAQEAETNPVVLMGMTSLLCRFGLFQDALRIIGRSLKAQAVPVREMMRDTARFIVYNEMKKQIDATNDGTIPMQFGVWADQMKTLYAKQTEQRKQALSSAGKPHSTNKGQFAALSVESKYPTG